MDHKNRRKQIALIDDDSVTNFINTKIISMSFDFDILDFTNAEKALSEFKKGVVSTSPLPDLIFLDINMPGMDGWEFLVAFEKFPHELLAQCRVFMLTSSIDQDDVEKSKGFSSVQGFISKPLTVEKLRILN